MSTTGISKEKQIEKKDYKRIVELVDQAYKDAKDYIKKNAKVEKCPSKYGLV